MGRLWNKHMLVRLFLNRPLFVQNWTLSYWIPVEGTCESNLQLQVEHVILPTAHQYVIACYCKLSMKSHILIFKFLSSCALENASTTKPLNCMVTPLMVFYMTNTITVSRGR